MLTKVKYNFSSENRLQVHQKQSRIPDGRLCEPMKDWGRNQQSSLKAGVQAAFQSPLLSTLLHTQKTRISHPSLEPAEIYTYEKPMDVCEGPDL